MIASGIVPRAPFGRTIPKELLGLNGWRCSCEARTPALARLVTAARRAQRSTKSAERVSSTGAHDPQQLHGASVDLISSPVACPSRARPWDVRVELFFGFISHYKKRSVPSAASKPSAPPQQASKRSVQASKHPSAACKRPSIQAHRPRAAAKRSEASKHPSAAAKRSSQAQRGIQA